MLFLLQWNKPSLWSHSKTTPLFHTLSPQHPTPPRFLCGAHRVNSPCLWPPRQVAWSRVSTDPQTGSVHFIRHNEEASDFRRHQAQLRTNNVTRYRFMVTFPLLHSRWSIWSLRTTGVQLRNVSWWLTWSSVTSGTSTHEINLPWYLSVLLKLPRVMTI